MKFLSTFVAILSLYLVIINYVNGEEKISPKLDFEGENNTNKSTATNSTNSSSTSGSHSSRKDGKISPKIDGVRITVDTAEARKVNRDSGSVESIEIVEDKKKNKIGIHTDITFEITAGNGSNNTESKQSDDKDEDENASVPIFKGRRVDEKPDGNDDGRRVTTYRPRKPYDPKSWYPDRQYPPSGTWVGSRRNDGGFIGFDPFGGTGDQYYPSHHHHNNVPFYIQTNERRYSPEIYHNNPSGWSTYVPLTSRWTTERPYFQSTRSFSPSAQIIPSIPSRSSVNFKPYPVNSETPRLRPCYCVDDNGGNNAFHDNNIQRRGAVTTMRTTTAAHINDKLETPFSIVKK